LRSASIFFQFCADKKKSVHPKDTKKREKIRCTHKKRKKFFGTPKKKKSRRTETNENILSAPKKNGKIDRHTQK